MNKAYLGKVSTSPYEAGTGVESTELRNKFLSGFALLPASIQDFLTSDATSSAIADLSEYYDLDVAQTESLAWTIRNVAIGDIYIKEFSETLSRMLDIDLEKSKEIVNYTIKNIFPPILEDFKVLQIQKFGNTQQTMPPNASPQTISIPKTVNYPGADLPETGGNIIDLRQK